MKKIVIRQPNGKLKKWFVRSIMTFNCFIVLIVGIVGIVISGNHPYSEIAGTSISKPEDWNTHIYMDPDNFVIRNSFDIQIQIKNHDGADAKELLTNEDFNASDSNNHGYIQWSIDTDAITRKALDYVDIWQDGQDNGWMYFDFGHQTDFQAGYTFNLYVEALVHLENPNFVNSPIALISDPVEITLTESPT